ncbi:MAG: RHS repeat-associated core domain-containing protein [Deltaproteobacteria bacterium]|nr:RHS repeat-associated core domain-containing protein [Deltaproteobacteria bacterium]
MKKVHWHRGWYLFPLMGILPLFPVQAEGVRYSHGDHVGSSTIVTNEDGHVTQALLYSPDGEILSDLSSSEGESSFPFYTGQEFDASTELFHYGARCYDPVLSRFLSIDPIRDESNPQDLNLYAYAWNNPLRITDPSGKEEKENSTSSKSLTSNDPLFPSLNLGEQYLTLNIVSSTIDSGHVDSPDESPQTTDGPLGQQRLEPLDERPLVSLFDRLVMRILGVNYEEEIKARKVLSACYDLCLGMTREEVEKIMGPPQKSHLEGFITYNHGVYPIVLGQERRREHLYPSMSAASAPPRVVFDEEIGCVVEISCTEHHLKLNQEYQRIYLKEVPLDVTEDPR